jgi:TonB family protein
MDTRAKQSRSKPRASTANDRFKHSFKALFHGSIAAAAIIHFLVLAYGPHFSVEDLRSVTRELLAIEVPLEVEIPPPPEQVLSPQVPVLAFWLDVSDDITIAEVTFATNPVESLPPPPIREVDLSEEPTFTPRTIEPELRRDQRTALRRYLERNYPRELLSRGIGARAVLWAFVNADGEVHETRIVKSSGYPAFDRLAEDAVRTVRFSPAWNRDTRVPVWIQLPIVWQVRS